MLAIVLCECRHMGGNSLRGEAMQTWLGVALLDKHRVQVGTWGREGEAS